jgi:hypothetical protein
MGLTPISSKLINVRSSANASPLLTGGQAMNVFVIAGALFLIGTVTGYTWLTRREALKA